jgi:hypothetical protein
LRPGCSNLVVGRPRQQTIQVGLRAGQQRLGRADRRSRCVQLLGARTCKQLVALGAGRVDSGLGLRALHRHHRIVQAEQDIARLDGLAFLHPHLHHTARNF